MSFLLAPLMILPVVTQTLGLNSYIGQIPVVGGTLENIMTEMNPMTMVTGLMSSVSSMVGGSSSSSMSSTELEVIMIAGAGVGVLLLIN